MIICCLMVSFFVFGNCMNSVLFLILLVNVFVMLLLNSINVFLSSSGYCKYKLFNMVYEVFGLLLFGVSELWKLIRCSSVCFLIRCFVK